MTVAGRCSLAGSRLSMSCEYIRGFTKHNSPITKSWLAAGAGPGRQLNLPLEDLESMDLEVRGPRFGQVPVRVLAVRDYIYVDMPPMVISV